MAVPDIANFFGAVVLQATTGCTLAFDATFTNVNLARVDKEAMTVSFDFVSDGDITASVWDESGSGPTVIEGENALVNTPPGFNIHENEWTASITVDAVTWTTFDSRQKRNRPGNSEITGSIVGVVEFDAANTEPYPTV